MNPVVPSSLLGPLILACSDYHSKSLSILTLAFCPSRSSYDPLSSSSAAGPLITTRSFAPLFNHSPPPLTPPHPGPSTSSTSPGPRSVPSYLRDPRVGCFLPSPPLPSLPSSPSLADLSSSLSSPSYPVDRPSVTVGRLSSFLRRSLYS